MSSDRQPGQTGRWQKIEELPGEFNIGYATGASCYLIDEQGRPRSEGYHEITTESVNAGPQGNRRYIGTRGATEHRVSPISATVLNTGENSEQ